MSVTNTIRDDVIYDDESGLWSEETLTNEEIENKLKSEKKKAFLSFAYGVWVTAYARDNLLRRVIELDEHVVYCDTDSIKVLPGYDKTVFTKYNESVKEKIKFVSNLLDIEYEKYAPKDIYDEEHLLGVFEDDGHYEEFKTQGSKKYAYTKYKKNSKINLDYDNVIKEGDEKSLVLEITVAGVPKVGAKALKSLEDFRDDFVFTHDITNKNLLVYVEEQEPFMLEDYNGIKYEVNDKTGCCIIPTTYELGKSEEYATLINDASSKRSVYIE